MTINVRAIDPLNHAVPIVDDEGRPTPQFIRQWVLARNVNLTVDGVTLDIETLSALLSIVQADAGTLAGRVTALEGRSISAGTGLSGGGSLAADRTLSLANTAVTPGEYGSATHSAKITVDAQGRITAVENVLIVP